MELNFLIILENFSGGLRGEVFLKTFRDKSAQETIDNPISEGIELIGAQQDPIYLLIFG